MQTYKFWSLIILTLTFFTACDPEINPVNEEEAINEAYVDLMSPSGDKYHFSFVDSDGDGPQKAHLTADTLPPDTELFGTIRLVNTLASPVIDVTEEIVAEGTDHQLFYQIDGHLPDQFTYLDFDADNRPVGTAFKFKTGSHTTGKFVIYLRHKPAKDGLNVSAGDVTNAGGETDVELDFPYIVR